MLQASAHKTLAAPAPGPRLYAEILSQAEDIRAAQRLRYESFCEEYGVTLPVREYWNGAPIDVDAFDAHCQHLAVRETATGAIVGYTRALCCDMALRIGGYYSALEFELDFLAQMPGRCLEVGRTCIRKDYRSGATIAVLWRCLSQLLLQGGYNCLFGCASISLADGGAQYRAIMADLRRQHFSAEGCRVRPRLPIPATAGEGAAAPLPPLLRAYIRMGAKICGEACWDPDFNVADVFIWVDTALLNARYARHFLRAQEPTT